jgi:hypothetical protein
MLGPVQDEQRAWGFLSRGADMAEKFFRVLTIRSAGTTAQDALYPLLNPEGDDLIAREPLDKGATGTTGPPPPSPGSGEVIAREPHDSVGLEARYCRASRVTVSRIVDGQERPLLSLRRLKFLVFITAGRLALACRRYPAATMLTVAGPGSGLAARGATAGRVNRQPGSMMVGHMRYPWIRSVSAVPGRRWFGRGTIVIEYSVPERVPMLLRLDLRSLPIGQTPAGMAAEICSRVVTYWLTNAEDLSETVRGKLAALGQRAANDLKPPEATGQAATGQAATGAAITGTAKTGTATTGPAPADRRRGAVYRLPVWYPATGAVPFLQRPRPSRDPYTLDEAGEE